MANLMHSARLLVSDLASTLLFLAVLLITKDLMLAVALGVGLGVVQIGWMKLRRQKIDTMQWLSIGLVVVSGIATMLTSDAALRDAEAFASSTASSAPTCCGRAG